MKILVEFYNSKIIENKTFIFKFRPEIYLLALNIDFFWIQKYRRFVSDTVFVASESHYEKTPSLFEYLANSVS